MLRFSSNCAIPAFFLAWCTIFLSSPSLAGQAPSHPVYTSKYKPTFAWGYLAPVWQVEATEEQGKAASEGFTAGLSLINQGGDMAAGQVMTNAVSAAGMTGGHAPAGFGAVGVGSLQVRLEF